MIQRLVGTSPHRNRFLIELCMDLNIPTQGINNVLIMQDALQNGITDTELVSINSCRLYLRAIFLSDIIDGSGENILHEAWSGIDRLNNH
jgi:hypothetical protein